MNPQQRAQLKAKVEEKKRQIMPKSPEPLKEMPPVSDATQLRIAYACGHNEPLKNLTSNKCPGCRQAVRQEKARKKRETQKEVKPKYHEAQRLPDGSAFEVAWDAERQLWFGGLDIPSVPHFQETSSGVFRLLMKLDAMYREHLAKEAIDKNPTLP